MDSASKGLTALITGLASVMIGVGFWTVHTFLDLHNRNYERLKDTKPVVDLCKNCLKDGYTTAIPFFLLGIGMLLLVLLLPRLRSFKAAGMELVLIELQAGVKGLKEASNQLQQQSVGEEVLPEPAFEVAGGLNTQSKDKRDGRSDPQKGKWGGHPSANGRELSAEFLKGTHPGEYQVKLMVMATNDKPLHEAVRFHLPPTFRNPDPVIAAVNNAAQLYLSSVSRPFTIGAETDGGTTRLELDLTPLFHKFLPP
ncbi:hypothetical protein [Hymenobacter tenuis]